MPTPTDRRATRAKVLTTKLPPPPSTTYPAGSTIARFGVPGRPVPWSVPPKLRRKAPRLIAWQRAVNLGARVAMAGRLPHDGPVTVSLVFHLFRRGNRRFGDACNLQKGTVDALQGVIFLNDNQVGIVRTTRAVAAERDDEGVRIEVKAIGPAGASAERREEDA